MRYRSFSQLFLFGLLCLCGPVETANSEESPKELTENATVPEYVPFPFFERTLEEELEIGPLLQPSTKLFEAAFSDEETRDEISETAPDPASVLRPRYQKVKVQPQRNANTKQTLPRPTKTATMASSAPKTAGPAAPTLPENDILQNPSASDVSPPFEPIPLQANNVTLSGHFINNAHTCDEWTCGTKHEQETFRHLGAVKRGRGYCDACGMTTCSNKTFGQWFIDGWMTFGATFNFERPESGENLPLRYNDGDGIGVMNQLYVSFGRNIDKRRNNFDVGGRIDILYGTDYFATSSLNLETRAALASFPENATLNPYDAVLHWNSNNGPRRGETAAQYGVSLPQAFAEVFVPFGFGTTIKAGHFYSGMGLESAMSPRNFFYSHSYSFMYGSPTTLTGITATTQWTKRLSTIFGVTQGWNVFDNPMDRVNWLGGVQWESLDKETALSFIVHSGKESERPGDVRTGYTLALNQLLTKRLRYSLEHTLGYEGNAKRINLGDRGSARWCSIAQYLQWELNDQWAVGLRGEWFHDDGYSRIVNRTLDSFVYSVSGKDLFEITLGVNWKPIRFITIRPELRYDWANTRVYNKLDGTTEGIFNGSRNMIAFAVDAVVRF